MGGPHRKIKMSFVHGLLMGWILWSMASPGSKNIRQYHSSMYNTMTACLYFNYLNFNIFM